MKVYTAVSNKKYTLTEGNKNLFEIGKKIITSIEAKKVNSKK
jgi:hypothetical protein